MNTKPLLTGAAVACIAAIAAIGALIAASSGTAAPSRAAHRVADCKGKGPLVTPFALGLSPAGARIYLGTLETLHGDQLTLETPRTFCVGSGRLTLAVPAGTSVRRDGADARIVDLQAGDTVAAIFSADHGDYILAGDRAYVTRTR